MEVDLDGYYPRTPLRSIAQLGRISRQEGSEQLAYAAYAEGVQRCTLLVRFTHPK
jgi:hypothetical protein